MNRVVLCRSAVSSQQLKQQVMYFLGADVVSRSGGTTYRFPTLRLLTFSLFLHVEQEPRSKISSHRSNHRLSSSVFLIIDPKCIDRAVSLLSTTEQIVCGSLRVSAILSSIRLAIQGEDQKVPCFLSRSNQ
eukprot:scaffold3679_cov128-Skeletonema_menzelii.AAC.10